MTPNNSRITLKRFYLQTLIILTIPLPYIIEFISRILLTHLIFKLVPHLCYVALLSTSPTKPFFLVKVLVSGASKTGIINLNLLLLLINKKLTRTQIFVSNKPTPRFKQPIHPGYSLPNNDELQLWKFQYIPWKLGRTYLDP